MRISSSTDSAAMFAFTSIRSADAQAAQSLTRLASGLRINKASDDAAGLVISEKLRAQAAGTRTAMRNAQDGISMLQTADGALGEVSNILQRMRDLSLHYNNGSTDTDAQLADLAEFDALTLELDRINASTKWGTQDLFNGAFTKDFVVGANGTDIVTVDLPSADPGSSAITMGAVDAANLGATAGTMTDVATLDDALAGVTMMRGYVGAMESRLSATMSSLSTYAQGLTDAASRITDTDMAAEATAFASAQVRQQVATAMLAQANAGAFNVLSLLR